jgi:drug/metabolite transporter (DMT)-like permease
VGVLWGLVAAAGLAVYFVVGSSMSDDVPPLATAWAGLTVGAASLIVCDLLGVVSFQTATADVRLGGREMSWLVPLLGLSLMAAAVAYATGIAAARMLGARVAAMLGLTEVLFAIALAWALLAQVPGYGQAVGSTVVLAGIALVHAAEPRQNSDSGAPVGGGPRSTKLT